MWSDTNTLLAEMTNRYAEHQLPWDMELPPPEVMDIVRTVPPGRALDLGCGLGRACIYLAQHGWQCDGVDFVEQAIAAARVRVEQAGVANRIAFYRASVANLDFLQPGYDLLIDVGCLHAQTSDVQQAYARHAARLLKPGGLFLLFAHVRTPADAGDGRWMTSDRIQALFQPGFATEHVAGGSTTVGADTWASTWYWMRRS